MKVVSIIGLSEVFYEREGCKNKQHFFRAREMREYALSKPSIQRQLFRVHEGKD